MTFGSTTTLHTSFDEAVEQAPRDVADQAAATLTAAITALGQPVEAK